MARSARRRVDAEMLRRGLASDVEEARRLIDSHRVTASGSPVDNAARLVSPSDNLHVKPPKRRFVSRAGLKLENALTDFAIDLAGRRCLDIGASTGGFTDCLLQRSALHVTCVDVGRAQLHHRVLSDPRVTSLERTNATQIDAALIPMAVSLVVIDVSFCSVLSVIVPMLNVCANEADVVMLVKPQFEAERGDMRGSGGIVRDPTVWAKVLAKVETGAAAAGLRACAWTLASPKGAQGNCEFFLHAHSGEGDVERAMVAEQNRSAVIERAAREIGHLSS